MRTHKKRDQAKPATDELEALVRAGRFSEARRRLREIRLGAIAREEAAAYANLATRLDLNRISLRILNPIVRGRDRWRAPATAAEKIEYAAALRNSGMVAEAAGILSGVDASKHPRAAFQLALCLISEWRYGEAIPILRSYVESFEDRCYAMCVGKVNLLAALVYEGELEGASKLIGELRRELDPSSSSLLHRNTLELSAQFEILRENWDRAISYLEEARHALDQAPGSVYSLWIMKWLAIARSHKARRVTPDLPNVRRQAIDLRAWEIVRDCDFHAARIRQDRETLTRLYFGTPFWSYRSKILDLLDPADIPAAYRWGGKRGAKTGRVLDLTTATLADEDLKLRPGHALHRLLIALTQDFYKPVFLLTLFSKLFPGENFDPDTSPNRVRQIIARFRRWVRQNSLPLEVQEESGDYRLRCTGPLSIAIPREPLPLAQRELELLWLRSSLGTDQGLFSTREAVRAMGSSKSAARRLLQWAVDNGRARLEGHTNRARYRLL